MQLIFIGLESAELSRLRVAHRVKNGGHDVPSEKLATRYPRTLENLAQALAFVPTVRLYDNSRVAEYRLLGVYRNGQWTERHDGILPGWAKRFFPT